MNGRIAFFMLLFVAVSTAHLCLLNPHQRGSETGFDSVGASNCALTTAPCGSRSSQKPELFVKSGSNFTVAVIKNLDHWNSENPGNFTVRIADSNGQDFKFVASVPDTAAPSLTPYLLTFSVPKLNDKFAVVQAVYYTNNPDAPPAFYQCADIGIVNV